MSASTSRIMRRQTAAADEGFDSLFPGSRLTHSHSASVFQPSDSVSYSVVPTFINSQKASEKEEAVEVWV